MTPVKKAIVVAGCALLVVGIAGAGGAGCAGLAGGLAKVGEVKGGADAAKVWANLEPESSQARNTLAAVLISQGPLSESKQFLAKWIAEANDAAWSAG